MKVFSLSDTSSILTRQLHYYFSHKEVALVGFYTTYLTPNITEKNNKLTIFKTEPTEIHIPVGQYSFDDFKSYLSHEGVEISADKIINRIKISSQYNLRLNTINTLLGFSTKELKKRYRKYWRYDSKISSI